MFIDSHAHMTFQEVVMDELVRAQNAGVHSIINICTDISSLTKGLTLAKETNSPKIYTVAATTPHDVVKDGEAFFPVVEKAALDKKLVAIGETGLDYYYEHSPKDIQKHYLRKYLQLAKRCELPTVIHCRDAFTDFYTIWDEEKAAKGVLHCFTGSMQEVKEGLERGFYISCSGIVTFPKNSELREAIKYVPLDRLLIETDSPYLAPHPLRGRKNEPAFIVETAKVIADLRGIQVEELAEMSSQNAKVFFKL